MEKSLSGVAEEDIKTEKKEFSPALIKIKKMLQDLKSKELAISSPDEYKKLSYQTYKDLCSFFTEEGAEFVTDVNDIYKKYTKNNISPLIIRREDPEKVIALNEDVDINIHFDPKVAGDMGDKYANCAIWPYGPNAVSGIRNAFLEGKGMAGPIVALMAVNNNPKNTNLKKPDDFLLKVGDIEREAVRIVSGTIIKQDLEFIILRIQKDFFPPESLTDREKQDEVKQIFRGFTY